MAAERAVPSRHENRALPVALSINILNAMQDSAESELQKRACGGLVTLLTESITEDSSPPHDDVSSNSSQSEIAEAISDYVAATSSSSARSRGAETYLHADLYARQVLDALSQLVRQGRISRRRSGVHLKNGAEGFDDEVTIDGVDILVEIKYFDLEYQQISRRIRDVRHKGRRIAPSQPLLLVNPVESRVGMDRETDGPPFAVMKWNIEDGAYALEAALIALAEAAKENPLPKGTN
jgi:hypothetical protein